MNSMFQRAFDIEYWALDDGNDGIFHYSAPELIHAFIGHKFDDPFTFSNVLVGILLVS